MIKFQCNRFESKSGNPILSDAEIDVMAEDILRDYKPSLLEKPGQIDYLHFLEYYLGANIDYQYIYHAKDQNRILGATAFNSEFLKVFNRDDMKIDIIEVQPRTIILDNSLFDKGSKALALYTGLHEGGHLWMHPKAFCQNIGQINMFDEPQKSSVICCRTQNIESNSVRRTLKTPEDWREHQADYFASAIAMPKSVFIKMVEQTLHYKGYRNNYVVYGGSLLESWFADQALPRYLSDAFGVSRRAASIKLRKFGYVVDKNQDRQLRMDSES